MSLTKRHGIAVSGYPMSELDILIILSQFQMQQFMVSTDYKTHQNVKTHHMCCKSKNGDTQERLQLGTG